MPKTKFLPNPWNYGSNPPKSWAEAADTLKRLTVPSRPKKNRGIYERLIDLESLVKEKK